VTAILSGSLEEEAVEPLICLATSFMLVFIIKAYVNSIAEFKLKLFPSW
jgi:hypothetical protein